VFGDLSDTAACGYRPNSAFSLPFPVSTKFCILSSTNTQNHPEVILKIASQPTTRYSVPLAKLTIAQQFIWHTHAHHRSDKSPQVTISLPIYQYTLRSCKPEITLTLCCNINSNIKSSTGNQVTHKHTAVPVGASEAYGGHSFLTSAPSDDECQLKALPTTSSVRIGRDFGWAEQPVWTFWEGKISSLGR